MSLRLKFLRPSNLIAVAGLLTVLPRPGYGQDIEMTAYVMGQQVPAEYYQIIQRQPDFFEIKRGWTVKLENAQVTGTLPVVIVQALFGDSPEPRFTREEIQQVLFDGPAPYGTLTDFYNEVSGGRLTVEGQVLPWVRTEITLAETQGGARIGEGTPTYMEQALREADIFTDFGQFDNDGPDGIPNSDDDDGHVDALAFQYIEEAASCGGPAPWPHRSRISNWTGDPFATNDLRPNGEPVLVNDYIMQSTVTCETLELLNASVIAHEMGHILGLPDLYDNTEGSLPAFRAWVAGCWSLMAGGTWGCGDGSARTVTNRPPHMGPWEKSVLGWLTEEQVVGAGLNQEFVLEPVITSGKVLRVPLSESEYFLVEFRDGAGFDLDLPLPGVLVYHVDVNRPRRPCRSCDKIYHVHVVEADGDEALLRSSFDGGDRGVPGDVFGASGPQRLSNVTTPSTRLHSGAASPVTFYSISFEGGLARIVLSTTTLSLEQLLSPFVDGGGMLLSQQEAEYLDSIGNQNGQYDVGDLRRYLKEHPSVIVAAAEPGSQR
jgi:immune inhibitor A